jgi:hypothetical protein
MILSILYQALELCNIHLNPFTYDKYGKQLARFSYKDPSIDLHDVSIISPPLRIIDYNPDNSRLRLDVHPHETFQRKLMSMQENLVSTFHLHQQSFLNMTNSSYDSIHNLFHFLLTDMILHLYIYPTVVVKKQDGTTCNIMNLSPGDTIRCIIRFHGISQIQTRGGMRLRLQHSVPIVWLVT